MKRAAAILFAASWSAASQQSALERAWDLAAHGDRAQAEVVLQSLIGSEPANADARLLLGSLLMEDGTREPAIQQLSEAVRLRPRSGEALNALGEAYGRFGERVAAGEWFAKACAADPKLGIAQSNWGAILLEAGDAAGAATHLDQAVKLLGNPSDAAEAHYLRAKIDTARGETKNAESHLEKAVALRADFAEAWSDLGQAYKVAGDDTGAVGAFERAVRLNLQDAVAQYRLGAQYLRLERPAEALTPLEAANRLSPGDQSTLYALTSALRQSGQLVAAGEAQRQLAEVIRHRDRASQDELLALRLNNEGALLEKQGNVPEALARYGRAISLYPDHAGIQTNYAVALLKSGRWAVGLEELHRVLEKDPNNQQLRRAWRDALSQAPADVAAGWLKAAR